MSDSLSGGFGIDPLTGNIIPTTVDAGLTGYMAWNALNNVPGTATNPTTPAQPAGKDITAGPMSQQGGGGGGSYGQQGGYTAAAVGQTNADGNPIGGQMPNTAIMGTSVNPFGLGLGALTALGAPVAAPVGLALKGFNTVANGVNTADNVSAMNQVGVNPSFGQMLGGFFGIGPYAGLGGTYGTAVNSMLSSNPVALQGVQNMPTQYGAQVSAGADNLGGGWGAGYGPGGNGGPTNNGSADSSGAQSDGMGGSAGGAGMA